MAKKLIFLSHITEEAELAKIIKDAIVDEFSGFVDVFVSSDGETIRAGQNFLKVIEKGLVECIAAVYLISPVSVRRSWISFELGAVWIRNLMNELNDQPEIPALPFCHSGMTLASLPQPINNLNAIEAHLAGSLDFAFKSIQSAVGGSGRLRTDFVELAQKIKDFENFYTREARLNELFGLISSNPENNKIFIDMVKSNLDQMAYIINTSTISPNTEKAFDIINNNLNDFVSYQVKSAGIEMGQRGAANFTEYDVVFEGRALRKILKL